MAEGNILLQIKPVKRYTVPRYPRGTYHPGPTSPVIGRAALASAAIAFLLELCDCSGVGTTGPPPVTPALVTENEARALIDSVFAGNGIALVDDVPVVFHHGQTDSTIIEVDGYHDSLRVGYEYFGEGDSAIFTPAVMGILDSAIAASGPYVKGIPTLEKIGDYRAYLETLMQEFIDSLKARGII